MLKAIEYTIIMNRTKTIISKLQKDHNFDIKEDFDTIKTIIDMIKVSKLSDKEIENEILEMHEVSKEIINDIPEIQFWRRLGYKPGKKS